MGLIKKGENWFIDFWNRGKRYRKKISPDKRQAALALKKVKVAIAENKFLDIKKQKEITFEATAKEYIERYAKLNKKSWTNDENSLRRLVPFFKGKYLYEITPQLVEDYKAKRLHDGVKKTTVNRELALLKHIYTKAIEWEKASENPIKKVKLFKEDNQRVRFLEKGELNILLEHCQESLKPFVIVAVHSGMRLSEIINLAWDDIDFERGFIAVRNTKNSESRYVPMDTVLRDVLEKLKQRCNPDCAYIFSNLKGKRFRKYTISHRFAQAIKEANIRNFRFHDLRHTFASHLVMAGADIKTVMEFLGHKTLEMTMRYSHLSPDHKRSAVDALCKRLDTFWTPEPVHRIDDNRTGANLSSVNQKNGLLAQLAEQLTLNQ